jgi:hypothetical protein
MTESFLDLWNRDRKNNKEKVRKKFKKPPNPDPIIFISILIGMFVGLTNGFRIDTSLEIVDIFSKIISSSIINILPIMLVVFLGDLNYKNISGYYIAFSLAIFLTFIPIKFLIGNFENTVLLSKIIPEIITILFLEFQWNKK